MPLLDLTDQEAQSLLNIVATTKEHPWLVTNPLVQKIGAVLQHKDAPVDPYIHKDRRAAEHGGGAPDNGAGASPPYAGPNPERSYADGYAERIARERPSRDHYPD